jgi:predicted chitinase/LysM repeat protein
MTENLRTVPVAKHDTLSKIAAREGTTVKEILAVNPKITDPNVLKLGQKIYLPAKKKFELTVRFVNSFDFPPIGIKYELLDGKTVLASDRIILTNNEATLHVADGTEVTLMAQQIGDTSLRRVGSFITKKEHPVLIARINSIKIPSFTEPHPKTPGSNPASSSSAPPAQNSPPKKDQGLPNKSTKNDQGTAEHQILPGECVCGRDLTIDELAAVYPTRKKAALTPFLEPLNSMMRKYKIDSCLRKAHALAQIGHESMSLYYRAEVLKPPDTEQSKYNGYKGRGLIQITGKGNYEKYGEYKGKNFLGENRLLIEDYEYATDSAGWFWVAGKEFDLNKYADKNDLYFISATINGGFNGLDERASMFRHIHKKLNAEKCKIEANRSAVFLPFEKSEAYDTRDMAFAWGLWNDPLEAKKGIAKKDAQTSKSGYRRFLELNQKYPIKKRRFGFPTTAEMIEQAEERSK